MLRMDAGFALVASFINQCGYRTFNNSETGEPFSSIDLQPYIDKPEITLEDAMKRWG